MTVRDRVVFIPSQTGVVLDRDGWHIAMIPPAWWLEMTDAGNDEPVPVASLVPAQRWTSCRPGRGPCRRCHAHRSMRRA